MNQSLGMRNLVQPSKSASPAPWWTRAADTTLPPPSNTTNRRRRGSLTGKSINEQFIFSNYFLKY
jgi:hypothetical protein